MTTLLPKDIETLRYVVEAGRGVGVSSAAVAAGLGLQPTGDSIRASLNRLKAAGLVDVATPMGGEMRGGRVSRSNRWVPTEDGRLLGS